MTTKKCLFYFPKSEIEKPIIYHLVKDYDLVINIFRAKINPDDAGYLVLEISGREENIKKGLEFVKTQKVTVDLETEGIIWNQNRCTQCGHCLAHCPTHALSVIDPIVREINFDRQKCIECLNCIQICPFQAIRSIF